MLSIFNCSIDQSATARYNKTMKIKELIQKLVEVQQIDAERYRIKYLVEEEKPEELKILQDEFIAKRDGLGKAEEALKQAQLRKKDAELQEQAKRDVLNKAQGDLYKLKSNDEYRLKLKEIENLKRDISEAEDVELEILENLAPLELAVAKAKEEYACEEKLYTEKKGAVEKEIKTLEEQMFLLKDKLTIASRELSGHYWDRYSQLVESKSGIAIVPLQESSCGGCYMSLPPDMSNKIKLYEDIVFCDHCGRMLYIADDIY